MVTVVLHVLLLPFASSTLHIMVLAPGLKAPLASAPVPVLEVAPVTLKAMFLTPQLSEAFKGASV